MLTNQTFIGTPGLTYINSPILSGITVLGVWRNGMALSKVTGSAVLNEQYSYGSSGQLLFDSQNPFSGNVFNDVGRENVFVLFDV